MLKFLRPRGTRDWFGSSLNKLNYLATRLRYFAGLYQLIEVQTPIFESAELFQVTVGAQTDIIEKEMFTFVDKKNRSLVLRPEGTAAVMRAVLQNNWFILQQEQLHLFYLGPMFRYERPQKFRYRQFLQYGVEFFSKKTHDLGQHITILRYVNQLLSFLKITGYQLAINYLPTGRERKRYITAFKNHIKINDFCHDCQRRYADNPLRILDCKKDGFYLQNIPDPLLFATKEEQAFFYQIITLLEADQIVFRIDPLLIRGLDYYSGLVFQCQIFDDEQKTIELLGGGYYDQLASMIGSKQQFFCIGFAAGIDRLLHVIPDSFFQPAQMRHHFIILLLDVSVEVIQYSWMVGDAIQRHHYSVSYDWNIDKKLFKRKKHHFDRVIILGQQELQQKTVTIHTKTAQQPQQVPWLSFGIYLQQQTF